MSRMKQLSAIDNAHESLGLTVCHESMPPRSSPISGTHDLSHQHSPLVAAGHGRAAQGFPRKRQPG